MGRLTGVGFGRSSGVVLLGLASLVLLSGCSNIQVKLGMRVQLAKLPVTTMVATQYKNPGVGPGERKSLIVTFTQPGGKVLVTAGKGKGKVLWRDLVVSPSVVSVNKSGVLTLPSDPRVSDGKTGLVVITVPSHPGLSAVLAIPLRYNYPFAARYSGFSGSDGTSGTDGLDGSSGSMGSMDPDHPSAGGDGGNGTSGSSGGNGSNGGDGPDVQVRVTLRAGAHPLLQAGVTTGGPEQYFLVDPQGGSLTVTSTGGSGGKGGRGGRGGRGGSGGMGMPSGNSGSSGSDGSNGSDGSDGRGGSITVTYDPAVQPYLATIRTSNQGGSKPVFHQAPVAALW